MEKIFEDSPVRHFRKGQVLIYEGDPIESIYYLASGYVKVSSLLSDGSQRTIIIYKPGETFPLASFLSGQGIASYFYECLSDVDVRVMHQADFQKTIKGNLELGEDLIAYTYRLSQQFVERIETLSARSSKAKIVSLLAYLAKQPGRGSDGKIKIDVPLTTREIADMCGLTRETATLQMLRLKSEGLVSGRRFLVIDKNKLKKLNTR